MINAIFINCACLPGAVFFDAPISISHGDADTGCFQHGEIVWAVSECIAVFFRDGKTIQEKFHSGCLAGAFLGYFPDAIFMIKNSIMIVTEFTEFFYVRVRQYMCEEFIIGICAGVLTVKFGDVSHWNLFSHSGSEFGLCGRGSVIQDRSVGFEHCLDLTFSEKIYGLLAQKVGDCTEKKKFVIHVNVGPTAIYIAIKMEFGNFFRHHGFGAAGVDEEKMAG